MVMGNFNLPFHLNQHLECSQTCRSSKTSTVANCQPIELKILIKYVNKCVWIGRSQRFQGQLNPGPNQTLQAISCIELRE